MQEARNLETLFLHALLHHGPPPLRGWMIYKRNDKIHIVYPKAPPLSAPMREYLREFRAWSVEQGLPPDLVQEFMYWWNETGRMRHEGQ